MNIALTRRNLRPLLLLLFLAPSAATATTHQHGSGPALYSGAAQADITPPPGLPQWGHSLEATKRAKGYWTRLYAHAIVLIDRSDTIDRTETKVALVQLDLGASSALLLNTVAGKLKDLHYTPREIVLLASHTHAGPGGYFGNRFYNRFAAGRSGFDPKLVDWLAVRIANAIRTAHNTAQPAVIGIGTKRIDGVSRNRSIEAWRKNFGGRKPRYLHGLLPDFSLIRIDRKDGHTTKPIAALAFLPLHATAVEAKTPYYHGDVHGVAERQLATWIQKEYELDTAPIVGAAARPQGDVSPDWSTQAESEAERLGTAIADELGYLFRSLDHKLQRVKLTLRSVNLHLPGATTSQGNLCNRAIVGVPLMAGAEDGRSFLHGKFGVVEGRARKRPRGCQGHKVPAFGCLQRVFLSKKLFPRNVPMHYVRFGDLAALSTVPGEPTTETGRLMAEAIRDEVHLPQVIIAAHSGDYASYFTTPEEFGAQHYEGASTLYGPFSQLLLTETASKLAKGTATGTAPPPARPGKGKTLLPRRDCDIKKWKAIDGGTDAPSGKPVSFEWRGLAKKHLCPELPRVSLRCSYNGQWREVDSDAGLNFHVYRRCRHRWTAVWRRSPVPSGASYCIIRVARDAGSGGPIDSDRFTP